MSLNSQCDDLARLYPATQMPICTLNHAAILDWLQKVQRTSPLLSRAIIASDIRERRRGSLYDANGDLGLAERQEIGCRRVEWRV
ncbi:hypothetical protein AUP68_10445 [Ilyonectria robusta]